MGRRSKIDRLPLEVQAEIGRLRERFTLDEILAHLKAMGGEAATISRSGLHRYVAKIDEELAEDLRRSRSVAAFLAQSLDDAPGSQALRLNVELLQDLILQLLRKAKEAQREDPDAQMSAKSIEALAKSLQALMRTSRTDLEHQRELEKRAAERARAEAASAATAAAREAGLSPAMVNVIKAHILGVAA